MRNPFACGLLVLCASFAGNGWSQNYPQRPIRFIVATAPAGIPDIVARLLTPRLTELLGQQIVVDNRAGANAVIGTDLVAKAPADGYTWLFGTGQNTVNPSVTWRISNKPDRVSASNRGDDVMIEMRLAGRAQGAPADILRKQIGNAREITSTTINGLPAAIATTSIRGLPTRAAVVFRGKSAYLIGGQAKTEGAMQQALAAINATITSFHAMSETERNSERPLTLRVINAPPGATFAELARSSPLGKNAVSYLRLLNGLYPQGEPAAGQALKIVE